MAEYIANAIQEVAIDQNILFTETPVCGNNSIAHREGSGLITLRGITNQCRARFRIMFSANIAVPTGDTAGPISMAIAIDGEPIKSTEMIVTPAAVNEYFNIVSSVYIEIHARCCSHISVKNTSTQAINAQNANLIVERTA